MGAGPRYLAEEARYIVGRFPRVTGCFTDGIVFCLSIISFLLPFLHFLCKGFMESRREVLCPFRLPFSVRLV